MSVIKNSQEKNITNALISVLSDFSDIPTRQVVESKANELAEIFNYTGSIQNIVMEALNSITTSMGQGVSLIDIEAEHDIEWVRKRKDIDWLYSKAYADYLRDSGWSPELVQSLSDVTEKILGHLQDPMSEGTSWDRRGLVIGHVQSGKTANYSGVISRAADAGYKFIIVIAGIHNNLRKQTQERVDQAFIGRSSDPDNRRKTGVGIETNYPHPVTLTTIYDDFNKKTADRSGWKLNDFSRPIVLIIKKNVTTLSSLYKWLKEMNAEGMGQISDVPMLVIDDEADNASINTNKEELDPTRTNRLIREILGLFAKSCYIGYTATPFANIFINPEAYDEDVREELFPKDFIYCLDAPTTYFGPDRVFINEETSKAIVREIWDCEDYLPFSHKRDNPIHDLPPSLYRALDQFIVARAIRNLRGQAHKHCTMMINVSRFVPIQKAVRDFLSLRETRLRDAVMANYSMPDEVALQNRYMKGLKAAFDDEFAACEFSWGDLKSVLAKVFDHLKLYVINSKSDETLDYALYDRDNLGLTAIAVGGLSLSRGLTLEGLTVSYMYRNTKMYDTLMQMGRWFGYRPGYDDLCRVYLSPDSVSWYAHIAEKSEELVQQVKRMRRDRLTPTQFGLYVETHPERLLITAANKMRTSEIRSVKQCFSGLIKESHIVSLDRELNKRNFDTIQKFWENGFGGNVQLRTAKGYAFLNVPTSELIEFLIRFDCPEEFASVKSDVVNYLEQIVEKRNLSDVVLISPQSAGRKETPWTLNVQERAIDQAQVSARVWRLNKNRVASSKDEKLGLSDEQVREALELAIERKGTESTAQDIHFREVRDKPLLMLHSLQPKGKEDLGPVAAFGVSFPFGDYMTTVNVAVNRVWLDNMRNMPDDPDDEEDYDA